MVANAQNTAPTLAQNEIEVPEASRNAFMIVFGALGGLVMCAVTTLMVLMLPRDPALAVGVLAVGWPIYLSVFGAMIWADAQR